MMKTERIVGDVLDRYAETLLKKTGRSATAIELEVLRSVLTPPDEPTKHPAFPALGARNEVILTQKLLAHESELRLEAANQEIDNERRHLRDTNLELHSAAMKDSVRHHAAMEAAANREAEAAASIAASFAIIAEAAARFAK